MTNRRGKIPAVTNADVNEVTETVIETLPDPEVVECHSNKFGKLDAEYMEWIKFMEEEVVIMIGLSDSEFAVDPVPCGVNGQIRKIKRGEPTKIKRKFLDALIQIEFKVKPVEYEDDRKLKQTKLVKLPRMAYPISIIDHGPDPKKSQRWFQWRCNEGV